MPSPDLSGESGIHVSFRAGFPECINEYASRVVLTEDSSSIGWSGDETASVIVGKDNVTTSKAAGLQIELTSSGEGSFEGDIDLGDFTASDVHAIVIPHSNGAYYRYRNSANRLYVIFPAEQTQANDGVLNTAYFPLYARVGYSEITSGSLIQLKAAGTLIRFNVYGTPKGAYSDEILESVAISVGSGAISGTMEITSDSQSYYNGSKKAKVSLTEQVVVNGKNHDNGIKLWMGITGATRTMDTVVVTTNKAVYSKAVNYSITGKSVSASDVKIHRINLNLSNDGWERVSQTPGYYFSVNGGSSWSEGLPSSDYSTLAVKTDGTPLSEAMLGTILEEICHKSSAVALDMHLAEYESSTFPATFQNSGAISSIVFPSNVTEIAASAFKNCIYLTSVDLTGIESIGDDAFNGSGLVSLNVPDSVSSLGERAFGYCYDLTSVYYNSTYAGNSGTHGAFTMRNQASNVRNSADFPLTVTFGTSVTSIPRYCFDTNQRLVKVIIEGTPVMRNNWLIRAINLAEIICNSAPPAGSSLTNMDSGATDTNHFGRAVPEARRLIVIPAAKFRAYNESTLWAGIADDHGYRFVDAEPAFPSGNWPEAEPAVHSYDAATLAEIASLTSGSSRLDSTTAITVVAGGDIIYKYENPHYGGISDASYYIASCRKSMLSMLYGKYVEDGTINLFETIGQIGLTDKVEEGYETPSGLTDLELTATVQHLIEARSGIYHKAANDPYVEDIPRGTYAPGEHYAYNNWDFNAAGYVFELKTGKNIFDEFRDQIAVPLQMQDWVRSSQYKANNGNSYYSAYHMRISARDLARVAYMMLNKGRWGETTVISDYWWHEMLTERTTWEEAGKKRCSYGYMWWLFSPKWSDYTWHFKGAFMAKGSKGTWVITMPAVNTVVIVKSSKSENSEDDNSLLVKLCKKIASAYLEG